LSSTNHEDWESVDDDYLQEGAEKWRNARNQEERTQIEEKYGVRNSEFWRLPYWRPSKQVTIDAMHTLFALLTKNFFREGLRLNNPDNKDDPKNKSTTPLSPYAHRYPFTPPPPLMLIGSNPVEGTEVDDEDITDENAIIAELEWDHLSNDLQSLRQRRMQALSSDIRYNSRLLDQVFDIHDLLSDSRPSTAASLVQLRARLVNDSEKLAFMKELTNAMTYKTAVHIRHIHQYLWRPMNDDEIGRAKLVNNLKNSPTVLERVQWAIREVVVPGWIAKPCESIGLPQGGTPKADNWRQLFSIFLPLALLSLWQEE
ncbi:hypothetical protein F5051DRAFT_293152, partial [Lentinula edodes]